MKITMDCSKSVNENAGIARYTTEIAINLASLYSDCEFNYFFNFVRNKKRKNKLIEDYFENYKNVNIKKYPLPGNIKEFLFSSKFSLVNFWSKGSDIYHATEFLSFDIGLKIPQVLTVHDLSMIRFPEHRGKEISYKHGQMLKNACEKADHIISVSEATKKDIINTFKINKDKITVTHLAQDKKFVPITDKPLIQKTISKYKINFPYILFVGTIEPRKNIKNLMIAFDKFVHKNNRQDINLVIIGKKGWNTEDIKKTYLSLASRTKIDFLYYVTDEELRYFYSGAELFCYPSIFEGFGLPPLEAMASGAPVIVSISSSLPEVVGDAGILIDPNDVDAISEAMEKVIQNPEIQSDMSKKSVQRASEFSWKKCAQETHQVYEKVLNVKKQSK